jgi:hypothetical protein
MVNPMTGDATSGMRTLPTIPSICQSPMPVAASTAPSKPPMRAWLEEEGMPRRQVSRFQAIAPTSAAAMTTCPPTPGWVLTNPSPTVWATAVPVRAPAKLAVALMPMAKPGFSARVLTLVAIALAVSWKPLM